MRRLRLYFFVYLHAKYLKMFIDASGLDGFM